MLLTVNITVVDDIFPSVELEFRRQAARRAIATTMMTLHDRMMQRGTPYVKIKLVISQLSQNFASLRFANELR